MTGEGEDGGQQEGVTRRPQRRKKVVLAESKATRGVARTIVELEEQTSVGEHLVRSLVRAQFRTALTMALLTMVTLASLPLLFYLFPDFADLTVFGIRLSWVLLGAAPYPLIYGMGVWFVRRAERHERDFVSMVDR
ncbi:hypothetical protein GCM10010174_31800 [Kutzneria viridogrisea]|uniref:Integral membrane protein n=2 Tax=Kutzneria TaxID=43356 RepID=A0ABR6BRE9_9PSEU|nr:hypothetical protein [Kutzneria albida]AHH93475.1 putative membrane protein [Kutzneria albida DSM 43870]MBA8929139.1 hypothetical protein [Kutzneria viridogrisea]